MSKIIVYDVEARDNILTGVKALSRAVKVTLGPKGKNVAFDRFGLPNLTKDGVTVARNVFLKDPVQNFGAQIVKEAAFKTSDTAGDGTTTATILTEAIFEEGLEHVNSGVNPYGIKKGIDKAVTQVVKYIQKNKKSVTSKEQIVQVGLVSSNFDEQIGNLIADAMEKVGKTGVITVEESKNIETTMTTVEGLQFERGYMSPYFVSNTANAIMEMIDPYILIIDKKISNIQEIVHLLNALAMIGRSVVMIVDDMENEPLAALVYNKLKGVMNVCVVRAPEFGSSKEGQLEDIAVITGGMVIEGKNGITVDTINTGLMKFNPKTQLKEIQNYLEEYLGEAKKIIITDKTTTILDGMGSEEEVNKRKTQLANLANTAQTAYEIEKIQTRLAKICGGIAVIKVGAPTEFEMHEKKARVEDALHATRAAIEEGFIPGGGVALLRASNVIDFKGLTKEEVIGAQIIQSAIRKPFIQLLKNAGLDTESITKKIEDNKKKFDFGYNVLEETYCDMIQTGIIDPVKVTRCALEYAASIAGTLLTTECIILPDPEYLKEQRRNAPPPSSQMGGIPMPIE